MTVLPDVSGGRVSFARVFRSEWIKFATLRAHLPVLGAVVAGLAVMGSLPALAARAEVGLAAEVAAQDVLGSMSWVHLLVALVAAVFFASEYANGSARTTFVAVPTRTPVLLGKQLAIALPAAAAGVAGAGLAFAGNAMLGSEPTDAWTTVRAVTGAGLYLAAIAALSVAVGAIIRNLVGSILTVATLLTVAPLIVSAIPIEGVQRAAAWMPTSAGQLVFLPDNPGAPLPWWGGYLVLLAWMAGATIIAGVVVRARDV